MAGAMVPLGWNDPDSGSELKPAATASAPYGADSHTYGMMYGMDKTTVYLPLELKTALRRASLRSGRSEADLIREGIYLVTAAQEPRKPRIPLFESSDPTLAESVDDALRGFGES